MFLKLSEVHDWIKSKYVLGYKISRQDFSAAVKQISSIPAGALVLPEIRMREVRAAVQVGLLARVPHQGRSLRPLCRLG